MGSGEFNGTIYQSASPQDGVILIQFNRRRRSAQQCPADHHFKLHNKDLIWTFIKKLIGPSEEEIAEEAELRLSGVKAQNAPR